MSWCIVYILGSISHHPAVVNAVDLEEETLSQPLVISHHQVYDGGHGLPHRPQPRGRHEAAAASGAGAQQPHNEGNNDDEVDEENL